MDWYRKQLDFDLPKSHVPALDVCMFDDDNK